MLPAQPVRHAVRLAVGQQVDDAVAFEIADDRAVAGAAPPGPVVEADDPGASGAGTAVARIRRSTVLALTGTAMRRANRAPGRPPRAKPMPCWRERSRSVRRAWTAARLGRRSAKMRRAQASLVQRSRRTRTRSSTVRLCHGRSAKRRS